MPATDFVHLHLHSHYSILDGVCQIGPLVARAKELGFRSLALTDHGAMYGAIEFYIAARKAGIKPIIGMEAYVAPKSRLERQANGMKDASYHLTLLATSSQGYKNLVKLSTLAYTEGFYYRPRVDKEILKAYHEDIIALSGCMSGEVSRKLQSGKLDEAEATAREYCEIFGPDNFFLEIQDNGMEEQQRLLPFFAELSEKTGIPLVASSDVHYIHPEDAKAQDVMLCINTGKLLSDTNRMRMSTNEFYLKGAEQMRQLFQDYPEACDQTVEIAARCNLEFDFEQFHLPIIEPPRGMQPEEYILELVEEGLRERYGKLTPEIAERYRHELEVITKMGFISYFLMVREIVAFAKENSIPVGPGRGSAAGSIVSYALKITDIDPLKYGLLFERFLNEGRNEMPDIDLDFCKERRGEVVDFIIQRFGRENCAQIVTFGRLSAKSAIRDVGRVLDIPLGEVDKVAKLVPNMLKPKGDKTTIDIAMDKEPELAALYREQPHIQEMLDIAKTLDQVVRQTGKHAAGVLVADQPITEYCPLARRGEDIFSQYPMKILEKLGLCKVDVLGLETLTIIKKTIDNIRAIRDEEIDISEINLADEDTFQLLWRGETQCIFQFESPGMTDMLVKLQPDRFEDLIAAVAMYRPGPMQFIDTLINRKHGREQPSYLHERMRTLLEDTYGLIIYQEQVQALALDLAHFTLSEGDLMRRAMGKKDKAIMDKMREQFIQQSVDTTGCEIAENIFDQISHFAEYGFNKSHSACYALIAYQTAWLKAHYPKEFMAAHMTCKMGDIDEIVSCMEECRRMGIEVRPPHVNESRAEFAIEHDSLSFGLGAIKGVGIKGIESMVADRETNGDYKNLYDFCKRADLRTLNKGQIESLIKAGALDNLGGSRAQLTAGLEGAISFGNTAAKARARNQTSLFGAANGVEDIVPHPELPDIPPWPEKEIHTKEKESLGFYLSGHPLAKYAKFIHTFANASTGKLKDCPDSARIIIGGEISSRKLGNTKKGDRYARIVLEDLEGTVRAVV
ncbi:MAG: DNA polymerase III subunit alpha, partial [Planctomycetes bacterium]|nr:DNA polymerase III subunit alpha [Planctomycetota bacterium]